MEATRDPLKMGEIYRGYIGFRPWGLGFPALGFLGLAVQGFGRV